MHIETRDCVVLGGGPAGSTFAGILRKYAPGLAVTVLEKEHFPRWHIGESTIPVANAVFRDLEVYDALERSTFVKKMGITFVWGRDRTPWDADYLELERRVSGGEPGREIINVVGQDFSKLLGRSSRRDTPFTAFNVRRAEFDKMLLDQARAFGADVREGTRVTKVLRDAGGRVEAVRWENDKGQEGTIATPFVLDATGLVSLMTRGKRVRDPNMNNFAVHGYFAGATWKVMFNNTKERTNVLIASTDRGWIWYFPVEADMMSVGVVTNTAHFKDRLQSVDLDTFFWEMIRACPEVHTLLEGARLRDDVLPNGARIAACRDWSSWAEDPVGDGWAAAGDAALFVDPILSTGVTLAVQSAHRAAYTFNTVKNHPELSERALWRAYADYARGEAGSFLRLARYFYGNNRAAESWWWEAQRMVNATGRLSFEGQQAFTMATAGFFPTPRAITPQIVAPLVAGITGSTADLTAIFRDDGVPPPDQLAGCSLAHVAPFRLDLRTEPVADQGRVSGVLDVYHDLVTDHPDFTHRRAVAPTRIAPSMAPVVDAIGRHASVATLVEEAPSLLPPGFARAEDIQRSTLHIVRAAALKGFVRVSPEA